MKTSRKIRCRAQQALFRAAMPLLPYRDPRLLDTAAAAASACLNDNLARVLIVTGPHIASSGLLDGLKQALDSAHVSYRVFDRTKPDPDAGTVEDARHEYLHHDAHGIIAVGGGSPMDCAKAVAARIARPDLALEDMGGPLGVGRDMPPLICIPTTAGSGSEASVAAVVTDEKKRRKHAIVDFGLIPRYAVLDPTMTCSLPPSATAQTGMDALTHAVEAYVGRSLTRRTRLLSEQAVMLIRQSLLRAYRDGSDLAARDGMLRASHYAGLAFTRSYVGYVHAISHALGGRYGIPHGLANAIILPHMLRAYGAAVTPRLARLARLSGIASPSDAPEAAAAAFISWIDGLNAAMGIPRHVEGIREEDISQMARYADEEANPLYPVPVLMDEAELRRMFYVVAGSKVEQLGSVLVDERPDPGDGVPSLG